ncbi:MAG: DNA repair protein RadA [Clostridia bacterium]|nr:DNA repair protein RadA [Clostridia bacterium]
MAKSKTVFICSECGYKTAKWSGKCPECNQWNTLFEEIETVSLSSGIETEPKITQKAMPISEISYSSENRFTGGSEELDRVLGGGIVEGSLVLVGGEPGIGKSTLLLQICNSINEDVLYISGEESPSQIKMRAKRLSVNKDNLSVLCNTSLSNIVANIEMKKPKVAIIDSIQTIYCDGISSAPGSVSQVRQATLMLMKLAKNYNITIFIVGHVTKDGSIAGPRVLEHMVDCVLYFEGENSHAFRLLRAVKNRFGSTNEVGIFEMSDLGLADIKNPSSTFLNEYTEPVAGNCITCTLEGTRPILTEVQALTCPTFFPVPRRTASGVDHHRVVLLMAVLEKRLKLNLSNYDTYINIAGGMRLCEPASDLAVALSIYSNYKDIIIGNSTVIFGEVGLSGEVRSVPMSESRIKECKKLGFEKIIIPFSNYSSLKDKTGVVGVKNIFDAIKAISN